MASAAAAAASLVQEINRQELQAAIAKAVELRALHAALTHGSNSSPASLRLPPGASPCLTRLSGEDYPVFTPSYDEEPLPGYHYLRAENRTLSDTWGGSVLEGETKEDEVDPFTRAIDNKSPSMNREQQICLADDQKSTTSSCLNHIGALQNSPRADIFKSSRRTSSTGFKSIATCNKCKPAAINREADSDNKSHRGAMTSVSFTDTLPSTQFPPKNRSPILSWLFPRSKKKPKSGLSPSTIDTEDMSQLFRDWGMQTLESLKRELHEANESRNAALAEAGEMRSTLEELKNKMVQLETHCEGLKKALKEAVQVKEAAGHDRHNLARGTKSIGGGRDSLMPVSQEVMVEGFLQIVSEARLSVKQFCKTLANLQVDEVDEELAEKLDLLLQPYNLTSTSKNSRGVLYHLEALISQSLYQDFENCVFQKNGTPKSLDPHRDRQENFSAFVALRNLSWNEVLKKGTKYYSEDFSRFCDLKMSGIVSLLDWSTPWPEQLLHSFFVSAKCIWLLHLLAFSFDQPLPILRVEKDRSFDALYMEDVLLERHRAKPPAKVKIMVMPGFYVQDSVLKCKVLCRYRSAA